MSNEVLFQIDEDELEDAAREDESVAGRNYLIFSVMDLRIGLDAEQVVEIMNDYTVTYLPMMPSYIQGIFNMRGQIIPIMNIRYRLGKPPKEGDELLIVLDYNNTQMGIQVDSVDRMLNIPNDSIVPIPSQSAQKLVNGMCTLPDGSGTMLVLDCEQLIDHGNGF